MVKIGDDEDQGVVEKRMNDMDNGQSVCVCMTIGLGEARLQDEHLRVEQSRAGQRRAGQGRAGQSRAGPMQSSQALEHKHVRGRAGQVRRRR